MRPTVGTPPGTDFPVDPHPSRPDWPSRVVELRVRFADRSLPLPGRQRPINCPTVRDGQWPLPAAQKTLLTPGGVVLLGCLDRQAACGGPACWSAR